jgi:hypothetical protein
MLFSLCARDVIPPCEGGHLRKVVCKYLRLKRALYTFLNTFDGNPAAVSGMASYEGFWGIHL